MNRYSPALGRPDDAIQQHQVGPVELEIEGAQGLTSAGAVLAMDVRYAVESILQRTGTNRHLDTLGTPRNRCKDQ